MPFPYEALLLILAIIVALFVIRGADLFAATMLFGVFSLACTGIYTLVDAVDVAFTEAAVGAGISTVLFLATLTLTTERERPKPSKNKAPALAAAGTLALVMIYGTLDMPAYGDPDAPIHQHVAPRYLNESLTEVGPPNFVTSVLASYRSFDTFGETTVVFTAAVGVLVLLGGVLRRGGRRGVTERITEKQSNLNLEDAGQSEAAPELAQANQVTGQVPGQASPTTAQEGAS